MGKKRIIYLSTLVVFGIICLKTLFHFRLDPSEDSFTNVHLCPACFGSGLCPQFYHGDISLIGPSRLKYFKYLNSKNVFTGKLLRERVILKKLAHDWEIANTDKALCEIAKREKSCEVSEATKLIVRNSLRSGSANNWLNMLTSFKSETDISHCPSERLLSYIFNKLTTEHQNLVDSEHMLIYKIGEMMYSLLLNPEAVILQAFSQTEGWPFPRYYGACGRVIVEEYVGKSLAYFEDSPWEQRLDIAYQLLLISQTLTENILDFALYMTDVNMDNFAVRPDGTVLLIDVENIVVVDRLEARKEKKNVRELHQSKGELCKDCMNFSFEDLCHHDMSDHNYYAICKGLLVADSYYSTRGLLHGMPESINAQTNLSALVKECADPSTDLGRFHIVPKILQAMKSLL